MKPFEAKREDGRSYKTVAFEYLQTLQPEQIVTYDELAKELGLHPRHDLTQIQQAVREATKPLLKMHKRGVQVVTGHGFRIIPARENMLVANKHQNKSDRQMVRAIEFFAGTNLNELTEQELRVHQGQAMIAQALYASHQSLSKRITRLEKILASED